MSTHILQDTLDGMQTQYELNELSHELTLESYQFDLLADHLEAATMQASSENRLSLEYANDPNAPDDISFALTGEYFKYVLKKAWRMVWNMLKRLFRWVSEWLSKLFAGVKRMRSGAQKVIKKAEMYRENGMSARSTTITIGGASRLHMGGKVSAAELVSGLNNASQILGKALDIHIDGSSDLFDMIENITRQLDKIESVDVRQIEQAVNELNNYPHRLRADMHGYLHGSRDKELPGGYMAVVGGLITDNEGRPKNMPNIELSSISKRPLEERQDVVPMTPDEIIDTAKAAIDLLDEISARERKVKRLSSDFKKMNEEANKVLGNASTAETIQEKIHPHTYRMLIWFYRMAIPGSLSNVFNYQYATARTALQYATMSLKDYE